MSRIAEAKKLIDKALADLIEALEHGRSDALLAYLAFAGRFHKYSLRNQMLIYSQDPDATRVAGFHTWKTLGRRVRKGEHGLLIIVPMPLRRRDASQDQDEMLEIRFGTRLRLRRSPDRRRRAPRATHHRRRPRRLSRTSPLSRNRQVDRGHDSVTSIRSSSAASKDSRRAARSSSPTVSLPPRSSRFFRTSSPTSFSTKTPAQGPSPRPVLETEAEAVAHAVSSGIGLQTNGASSDYISLYDGNADTLRESLERIQRTARTILEAILPEAA